MARTLALVSLVWGSDVVASRTVRAGESLMVGSGDGALPALVVEHGSVRVSPEGTAVLVVPAGAVARVSADDLDTERTSIGPRALEMARGSRAVVDLGSSADTSNAMLKLHVEVMAGDDEAFAATPRPFGGARKHILVAAVAHAFALVAGSASGMETEASEAERVYEMARALAKSEGRLDDGVTADNHNHVESPAPPSRAGSTSARASAARAAPFVSGPDLFDPTTVPLPSAPGPAPLAHPAHRARSALGAPVVSADTTRADRGTPHDRVVERVIRQNADRFQACGALLDGPAATLEARFVIEAGRVVDVQDAGPNLEQPRWVACVLNAFAGLSFPMLPEEGRFDGRHRFVASWHRR